MLVTIQSVSQEFTKTGSEYRKVVGVTGDGKPTTKSVFDNLKSKWELLKENATLEFTMVKQGQFWNVADIKPIELPPPTKPTMLEQDEKVIEEALKEKPSGQEVGMWYKELGAWLMMKEQDKGADPFWKALRKLYFAQMFSVLSIKLEDKREE